MVENKTTEFVRSTLEELQKSDSIFGSGDIESIVFFNTNDKALQFLSDVSFVTVRIRRGGGGDTAVGEFPVVVKIRVQNDLLKEAGNLDVDLFVNEVTMYRDLLPELNGADGLNLVPKCYYSRVGQELDGVTLDPIVVLEDLRNRGYKVVKDELFLDAAHVKLALNKLGKFHGLGYKYKEDHDNIIEKCGNLKKLKFSAAWTEAMKGCVPFYLNRYISNLIKENKHRNMMEKFQLKIKDVDRFLDCVTAVEEPYATIIHGDFNKNNMAFLYNSREHPIDVKFFDLQDSTYGDPLLDLGFFLYMNTDQPTRDDHWPDFMTSYWTGVTSVAPRPGFTFDEFLDHFASRAVIGYVEPSFYMPLCIEPERAMALRESLPSIAPQDQIACLDSLGGEKGLDIVRNILLDLIDRGYVEKFLQTCDS